MEQEFAARMGVAQEAAAGALAALPGANTPAAHYAMAKLGLAADV